MASKVLFWDDFCTSKKQKLNFLCAKFSIHFFKSLKWCFRFGHFKQNPQILGAECSVLEDFDGICCFVCLPITILAPWLFLMKKGGPYSLWLQVQKRADFMILNFSLVWSRNSIESFITTFVSQIKKMVGHKKFVGYIIFLAMFQKRVLNPELHQEPQKIRKKDGLTYFQIFEIV